MYEKIGIKIIILDPYRFILYANILKEVLFWRAYIYLSILILRILKVTI